MRACFISILFAAVGLLAGCSTPAAHVSDSDAALRKKLEETQAQLDQLTTRTTWLDQKVRALEQSNAAFLRATTCLDGLRQSISVAMQDTMPARKRR